jgi:AmiR/NasT family two-component response regulator
MKPDGDAMSTTDSTPPMQAASAAKNIAVDHHSPASGGAARRVVIAEQDSRARARLARMLAEEGFDVIGQATDADQAVALTGSLRPDLVILDVALPDRDGIEAAAEITSAGIAPVVIVASSAQRELVSRARDAGALAYLVKPVSRSSLVPAVEVAVARHAETAALRADIAEAAQRLETRKVIDRAKGLLMAHHRMTEPEAFRWIQRTAMDRRATALAVAGGIVDELAAKPLRRVAS